MAGANNYAKKSREPYDLCPAGHEPARRGQVVAQGTPTGETKRFRPKFRLQGTYATSEPDSNESGSPGQRACVSGYVGHYEVCDNCGPGGDAGGGTPTTVHVFSSVVWLPYKGPRAIDVIIDGALYNRVHYLGTTMHSPKRRTVIRALTAIAMSCFAIAPKASGIPTFDGANFAQQLLSVMNQTQQLTQQTTMVQQNLANLQRLGGNVLSLADQAYSGQGVSMRDLVSSVSDLYQAGKQLQGMYDAASAEMKSLNMTPERWGTAFVHLAQTKGGVYRKQLDQDFATMETFASRAANLRQLSRQIPGIEGNVQGLQLLNQQSSVLAGELLEMRSLMQRQVVLDLQDRATKEDLNKLSVEGAQQRYDAVTKEAANKRSAIGKMKSLEFGL